jgi:phosphonate transport system permease protein
VASLDRDNAVAIMRLLQELCARRDVALVSVLHDPSVVSAGAARLSYLSGGELHDGPPAAPARTALPPATTGGPTPDATDSKQAHSPPESVVRDPLLPRGAQFAFFALAALGIYGISVATLDIDERQLENVSVGLGRFFRDLLPESPAALLGLPWATLLAALAETAQMSLLGTTAGAAVALPLAVLAAGNTGPRWIVPVMRLLLNAIRTIPSLIWALLFVAAVGFGPLAGVLALAVYSVGYLSKLFYEALEAADPGPQAALRQIGASGAQRFVHAVAPAALPLLLSACMFMLEYNVRAATLLGVVDAGGIGWHIKHFLDYRNFPAALTCLALVLGVVVVLDALSGRVRAWATAR